MSMPDIRSAATRFATNLDWLDSRHSFSFGAHHDPSNAGHGLLLVNNDDIVRAGQGFGRHHHQDMEIVTWVLSGELEHSDSAGNNGIIYPGLAQRMSAGRGISHSEHNASTTTDVHFLQMWVLPDTIGVTPGYEQLDVSATLATGALVPVASGQGHDGAIEIHQRDAVMWVGRLATAAAVEIPAAPHVHLFVARGSGTLSTVTTSTVTISTVTIDLSTGDAARFVDNVEPGSETFTAGPDGAEVVIWATA